jgi:alanine racemase
LTVTDFSALNPMSQAAVRHERTVRVHLKVDTGMHRLGCHPQETRYLVEQIRSLANLELAGVYSHLAKADDCTSVLKQQEQFDRALKMIGDTEAATSPTGISTPAGEPHGNLKGGKLLFHLASSEAARLFPFVHYDMVRIGLYLYGLEPRIASEVLCPAMSVRGRINQIKDIEAGESVGYGYTWTANRPTRLANVPIGYGDGVERALSNRIEGVCLGRLVKQVGTISMDQMLFDVTDVPEATKGEIITLIGTDGEHTLFLSHWAKLLNTITYEVALRMQIRLPRFYSQHQSLKGKDDGQPK